MKHYQVTFEPDHLTVKIHEGATLFEAAGQSGITLSSPCGGIGRCGKCKVYLLPSEKEVLACQYSIHHGLTVKIPDSSRFFQQQILEHGVQQKVEGNRCTRKIYIESAPASLDSLCDIVIEKLDGQVVIHEDRKNDLASQLAASQNNGVSAILHVSIAHTQPHQIVFSLSGLETGDTSETLFGIAVDIGTTTVVARLVNLNTSQVMATCSVGNPQGRYGADVVSRISYGENNDGLERLHQAIIECLNNLIAQTSDQSGIQGQNIYEVVVAGNTTMNHLFLKRPVQQLGQAPYKAYSLLAEDRHPTKMGLGINPAGNVHAIANIAGFVGSDTVAAALAGGLDNTDLNTLLIDIGTNGEIVYGNRSGLQAASCAAGPALEGAGIECGSPAHAGAIERVLFDGNDIDVDVIGDKPPRSICGSGLIDAIAVMLDLEIIDSMGRFYEQDEINPLLPKAVRNRLISFDDKPAFVLGGNWTNGGWQDPVILTQKDIRQLQLAKAAIRAGIELLLKKAEAGTNMIQQVLLAGAFGNYIKKDNAVRIGLLPSVPLDRIHFVGNAAGSGAEMILVSQNARLLARDLAKKINYVEIAHQPEFQMLFSEFLVFPEK